ncbi:helix-turn-helix domain-containing protein [Deinococcus sp.]|uniref:helix-turn-helix domain-containing protein n=1 Tax=Deinococcus sp. TaxID=47478 RepID=UPI0025BCF083|nr:helix-turn-helix domain-containing protein [Deinococcus sp.]
MSPLIPNLPQVLIARRLSLGLTQAALARQVGCTRQYVAQLERGERTRPSAALSLELAHALMLRGPEKQDFLALCGHAAGESSPSEPGEVDAVAVQLLSLLPPPAVLHDGTWHMRALNSAAVAMLSGLGFDARTGVSLLSLVFDPRHRVHFPGWEPWARYVLAQFKRDSLRRTATNPAPSA